jgi:hypothetical protein
MISAISREKFLLWLAPLLAEVNESAASVDGNASIDDEAAEEPPAKTDEVTLSEDGQTIVPGESLRSKDACVVCN